MASAEPLSSNTAAVELRRLTVLSVLSECVRILKADYLLLLFLSLIFLFPKCFSSISHPTRQSLLKAEHPFPDQYQSETLLALAFSFFTHIFSLWGFLYYLLGLWSITYVVFHCFYSRSRFIKCGPLDTIYAMFKSLCISFFPLLGVILIFVPNIVSLFNLVHFGQILFKGLRGTEKSDIDIFYVVLVLGCLNLHLEWNLAPSIIVVESGGLLESLRRSSLLMKGKKMLALSILLVYGSFAIILGLFSSWILEVQLSLNDDLSHGGWWKMVNWEFLFRILPASVLFMLVLLFNMVTNIVFYVYCIKPEDNEKEKVVNQSQL
ncbi:uncharacterized protein LOC133723656 [Rosa rugosa]|uniref:uncharacterized protein LOC133723656 n=1 Tax=Rosa rugosa TaxID=74645 RepID=UPI002B408134|nr:uncharacterized protein LOC133723656 [Rosa rugosa]